MQEKEENELKGNLDNIDHKISAAFKVKEEQMKSKSLNAMRATSRLVNVRSEKEQIDWNNKYGSLNKYVTRKREVEKKMKAKRKDVLEMKDHLKEKQVEKAVMMHGRRTAIKN